MKCSICELGCDIKEGRTGRCGMITAAGNLIREVYPDRILAAVDTPIESMPLVHYHPNGKFLQVCTVGCNFKCPGCVSEIITDHIGAVRAEFAEVSPEQIPALAQETGCIGVMFCFNEPTVSYFTFMRLAIIAKTKGLLMGCSTNGYMTLKALDALIPYLDFVNIGIKGTSPEVYRECGIPDPAPVFRNIEYLYKKNVYIEVSVVFRKAKEAEVEDTARFIASLSREIPCQVMRFIPFGTASVDMEPSALEAEDLCRRLEAHLDHVFLFNTPGTGHLNSRCPSCKETIMSRGFFGPMCASLNHSRPDGICRCGYKLPIKGKIHRESKSDLGYFGGYRTINAMSMIRSILATLGVAEKQTVDRVMAHVIRTGMIKGLYQRLNTPEDYFDTMDFFGAQTGLENRALLYREVVRSRMDSIVAAAQPGDRPRVYCSLGHPLIAVFDDKMEACLAERGGGFLTNRLIRRESRPGMMISREEFNKLAPDVMIVSDAVAWPKQDVMAYCLENGLDVPAVRNGQIFSLYPFRCSTNPDWILGLMAVANTMRPAVFHFDLESEAEDFYNIFYGQPFTSSRLPQFPWEVKKTS